MGTSTIRIRFGRFSVSTHRDSEPRYGVTRSTCWRKMPQGPRCVVSRYEGSDDGLSSMKGLPLVFGFLQGCVARAASAAVTRTTNLTLARGTDGRRGR